MLWMIFDKNHRQPFRYSAKPMSYVSLKNPKPLSRSNEYKATEKHKG